MHVVVLDFSLGLRRFTLRKDRNRKKNFFSIYKIPPLADTATVEKNRGRHVRSKF